MFKAKQGAWGSNRVNETEGGPQDSEIILGRAILRLLGTSRGALIISGAQKRERIRTLAKGAWMGRKETLNLWPQLFLKRSEKETPRLRKRADAAALSDELSLMGTDDWACLRDVYQSGSSQTPSPYTLNDHHQDTEKQSFLLLTYRSSDSHGLSWRFLLPLSRLQEL